MIYDYEIKCQNHEEILYLYFDLNNEFAKLKTELKKKKLKEEVEEFIRKNKINFKGTKIAILVGGLVVGTLLLNNPSREIEQNLGKQESYAISTLVEFAKPDLEEIQYDNIETSTFIENVEQKSEENNNENSNSKKVSTTSTVSQAPSSKNNSVSNNNSNQNEEVETENKMYVTVRRSNGSVINIEFEEYIIGVVSAEMPAAFHEEALKAQAVLARTYALKTLERNNILTDNSGTQNYKSNAELQSLWGSSYNTYYNKIKKAVETTKGMYLTYNGEIIDAVYHSTSNGMTEDAKNVWGNAVPYLVSVDSPYDSINSSFQKEITFTYAELTSKLGVTVTSDTIFNILSRTSGNRVGMIQIAEKDFTGVEVRMLLGLRSTDFEIAKTESGVVITTKGYGHGVGMSQYGANGMAKNGSTYIQILKHYYKGVTLSQK